MRFTELTVAGAYVIEPERLEDARGFFARVWCVRELEAQGLETSFAQASIAYSEKRGTLRGMHFQIPPHEEVKIVRCTAGAIFDAIVDLRPDSPTYLQVAHEVLSEGNRKMLYVPKGFAHGYQTLEDDTEVFYQMSEFYTPGAEGGVRWDDPALSVPWPDVSERIISDKDRRLPPLRQGLTDALAGGAEPHA